MVGAVHIAQALVPFASAMGFAVTVVDPRRSFASDERFPDVAVSPTGLTRRWMRSRPDARTAVVTLTHDPKLDDPALDRALKSPAFYIGVTGLATNPCGAAETTARTRSRGRGAGPHPGPGRAEYRGGHRAGDRAVHHRRNHRRPPRRAGSAKAGGMKFGPIPLDEARGAIIAHSQRIGDRMIRKGSVLDKPASRHCGRRAAAEVIGARLEPGDVPEDIAADRLARPWSRRCWRARGRPPGG